jgi:hypothetical protein
MKRKRHAFGRAQVEVALLRIAAREQLSGINAADYKMLGVIEALAHELAHALDLSPLFEISLRAMTDAEADAREAAVLRIEVTALAALNIRLSLRRLWLNANWRNEKPAFVQQALDLHERRCVNRFVIMVKSEVKGMHPSVASG